MLGLLPLAAAVATCEACERVAPVGCAVKWPNDVWIDERKVAGILIRRVPRKDGAVVGVSVSTFEKARGAACGAARRRRRR